MGFFQLREHYKQFGKSGLKLLYQSKYGGEDLIKLNLWDYSQPIYLRNHTSDVATFYHIFQDWEYDFEVKDPKSIIDCGANIGLASLFFARKYPNAKIFSVEPEQSNFEVLERNVFGYKNIKCLQKGIWNKSAILKVHDGHLGKWGFTTEEVECESDTTIDSISIPEIMEKYKLEEIDLIKIDIEGAEKELFSSNVDQWLPQVKTLVIELHDRMKPGCSNAFFKAITDYDFDLEVKGHNILIRFK